MGVAQPDSFLHRVDQRQNGNGLDRHRENKPELNIVWQKLTPIQHIKQAPHEQDRSEPSIGITIFD